MGTGARRGIHISWLQLSSHHSSRTGKESRSDGIGSEILRKDESASLSEKEWRQINRKTHQKHVRDDPQRVKGREKEPAHGMSSGA